MDDDEVSDLCDEIELSDSISKAEDFEVLAHGIKSGEHGRAIFLTSAGEHFQMREEYDRARRSFEEARADGGFSQVHPVAHLLDLALDAADEQGATSFGGELRELIEREQVGPTSCHFVGESFENRGRLEEAAHWYGVPLDIAEPNWEIGLVPYLCLISRHRVRTRLGLPTDRLDETAAAMPSRLTES